MKILITGGAGFLGGHLAEQLAENGENVDIVDNFARGVNDPFLQRLTTTSGVRLQSMDLLDLNAVLGLDTDYDIIFHLAAIIGVRHVLERPYDVLRDNTMLTANVIELARMQKNLGRLLFASTSEVTAGSLQHMNMPVPTPEDTPLALTDLAHPRTSYMLSKIYGEAMCLHAGLPVTIFRPHNIYGPRMGMVHVIPELLKRALDAPQGSSLDVASVKHRRAFCYVDDAVAMLWRLATASESTGGTYNIGNQDAEVAIGELVPVILNTVARDDLTVNPLPPTPGSPERRCPDMTRTIATTGYRPVVSLADGVAHTYKWYAENVFSGEGVSAV